MLNKIMRYLAQRFFQKHLLEAAKESRDQFFLGLAEMAKREKNVYIMTSPKMGEDLMAVVGESQLEEEKTASILSIVKDDNNET